MKGEIGRRGRSPRKEFGHVVKGEQEGSVEGKGWRGRGVRNRGGIRGEERIEIRRREKYRNFR